MIAVGRRNWLFAGSKAGGERAAAIYSIIETCKLNGVEPFAYISGVMQKIAEGWPNSRIDELMPWAEPHRSAASGMTTRSLQTTLTDDLTLADAQRSKI